MSKYQIQCELAGHHNSVRCLGVRTNEILTGGMDHVLKRWVKDPSIVDNAPTQYYSMDEVDIYDHQHWVTALLGIQGIKSDDKIQEGFVTGCMDKMIRIYNAKGEMVTLLQGHEGGITSLAWYHRNASKSLLLSGSWDGSCRIWDIRCGKLLFVLPGHENGVAVLGLPNGMFVTGSTGKQAGNEIIDAQLRFWDGTQENYPLIKTVKDHEGPIRQLISVPEIGFASCSNDGSIKIRSMDGNCIVTIKLPNNEEGKPAFVLGICMISNNRLVSASDDCSARIWSLDGSLLQTIEHPSGLWSVIGLQNGDFVSGCDDKLARVFTENAETCVPEAIVSFEAAVKEAQLIRQRGSNHVDVESLPEYNIRGRVIGKSEGQVQMFKKSGKAWACQWNGSTKTWCDIGEVTGTSSGGVLDGEAYDIVIPVEIELPRSGSIQKLQIGYNFGQEPFAIAQAFIDQHHLNQSYLREIADYITQRTKDYKPPVIDVNSENVLASEAEKTFHYFPVRCYNTFETVKVSKLMATLIDFNTQVPEDVQLLQSSLTLLEQTVQTIQKSAFYHSSTFTDKEFALLHQIISTWPSSKVYPALDLARLILVHPQGHKLLNSESNFLVDILKFSQEVEETCPIATRFLSLRVITNMFLHMNGREIIRREKTVLIDHLEKYHRFQHKLVNLSLATVLLNCSRLAMDVPDTFEIDDLAQLISTATGCLQVPPKDLTEDVVLRSFVSIGTMVLHQPLLKSHEAASSSIAYLRDFIASQDFLHSVKSDAVMQCVQEFTEIAL